MRIQDVDWSNNTVTMELSRNQLVIMRWALGTAERGDAAQENRRELMLAAINKALKELDTPAPSKRGQR